MKDWLMIVLIGVSTCFIACSASQHPQRVSILGDSYSTFAGHVTPTSNACYYGEDTPAWHEGQDVTVVEQTWWWKAICENEGFVLERNNSYSGSTIVNTPLEGMDEQTSFIHRADSLGNPDIILVFGGTNDYWNNRLERGKFQYTDWTEDDIKQFRPGTAYLLHQLQTRYEKAQIYFILNDQLEDIGEDICHICAYYHIPVIRPEGIDKCPDGHPTVAGMQTIADAVKEALGEP